MTINGRLAGNSFVFSTIDPNINLHMEGLNRKAVNEIWLSMDVNRLDSELCADLENELKRKIRL